MNSYLLTYKKANKKYIYTHLICFEGSIFKAGHFVILIAALSTLNIKNMVGSYDKPLIFSLCNILLNPSRLNVPIHTSY